MDFLILGRLKEMQQEQKCFKANSVVCRVKGFLRGEGEISQTAETLF